MKILLKRILYTAGIVLFYFTVWSGVRGFVTTYTVLPQVEFAKEYCGKTIYVDQNRPTSSIIHVYNDRSLEYDTIYYTTPAGFYLLFGLVFVVLVGGGIIYYKILLGYHLGFWAISILTMTPGFCIHPVFLHISNLGIIYLTPFVTFLVIIFLMSPKLVEKFKDPSRQKLS